ncbi:MAG: anhydro-N-acetylmuramic acid kinase [Longimicrobiales bacterium]
MRVVGLMSGTSLDGIDAAVIEVESSDREVGRRDAGDPGAAPPSWRLLAFETVPYSEEERAAIQDAMVEGSAESLARLHADLGEWFASAALVVCRRAGVSRSQVDLIGSHGQTVWHQPPGMDQDHRGFTLQLGDPATIAERTDIAVVSDFRTRDVAAGGQGAPLVPWVDRLLFGGDVPRVLLNIGGMANVARVPPRGSDEPIVAFDTGPGNAVINAAVEAATLAEHVYDVDGRWARQGTVDRSLLTRLLSDLYFRRPPPKSTGREHFGQGYVDRLIAERQPTGDAEWADLIATLTALVTRSIADAVRRWAPVGDGEVVVTGGGAENPVIMEWLSDAMDPVAVHHGRVLGLDPAAKEAVAFAVLAWAHVTGRPANVPEVTGAGGPRVLGSYTPA